MKTPTIADPSLPRPEAMSTDDLAVELMETVRAAKAGHPWHSPRLRQISEELNNRNWRCQTDTHLTPTNPIP